MEGKTIPMKLRDWGVEFLCTWPWDRGVEFLCTWPWDWGLEFLCPWLTRMTSFSPTTSSPRIKTKGKQMSRPAVWKLRH